MPSNLACVEADLRGRAILQSAGRRQRGGSKKHPGDDPDGHDRKAERNPRSSCPQETPQPRGIAQHVHTRRADQTMKLALSSGSSRRVDRRQRPPQETALTILDRSFAERLLD